MSMHEIILNLKLAFQEVRGSACDRFGIIPFGQQEDLSNKLTVIMIFADCPIIPLMTIDVATVEGQLLSASI
jgi:hypothetical protein